MTSNLDRVSDYLWRLLDFVQTARDASGQAAELLVGEPPFFSTTRHRARNSVILEVAPGACLQAFGRSAPLKGGINKPPEIARFLSES